MGPLHFWRQFCRPFVLFAAAALLIFSALSVHHHSASGLLRLPVRAEGQRSFVRGDKELSFDKSAESVQAAAGGAATLLPNADHDQQGAIQRIEERGVIVGVENATGRHLTHPGLEAAASGDRYLPTFLVRPDASKICSASTELVIGVLTLPGRVIARSVWRSWVEEAVGDRVKLFFPLGRTERSVQHGGESAADYSVYEESNRTSDILFGNYTDSYDDLPMKTMSIVKWFVEDCPGVKWVMKQDGDVVINWYSLFKLLDVNTADDAPKWLGHRWDNMIVIHDLNKANAEPSLPDMYTFPPYTSGPAQVFNRAAAEMLLERRTKDPLRYVNEDAMIGLLLNGALEPTNEDCFVPLGTDQWRLSACGKHTNSISDCACDDWCTYHAGSSVEFRIGLKTARDCLNSTITVT